MVGTTISHYRITEKLGEGGMGVVYKAEDTKLDRPVALKFLAAHLVSDEEVRKRFEREAKAAAALNHPNICHVYSIDETQGNTFIAMAFLEGEGLDKKIEAGPLKLKDALDIAIQTAQGLQAAHEKGIVHRDIKPANLMVTGSGSKQHVTIMDFGLAQLADRSKLTRTDETMGTVTYMSPEQTYGVDIDHRSDIWSLGVVIYEMVVGEQPFKGHYDKAVMYSITNEQPEPMTALRTGVPMELELLVNKCLAKDADERYQHTDELLLDLQGLRKKLESGKSTIMPAGSVGAPHAVPAPVTGAHAGPTRPSTQAESPSLPGPLAKYHVIEDGQETGDTIRYVAEDTELHRSVAIRVLPQSSEHRIESTQRRKQTVLLGTTAFAVLLALIFAFFPLFSPAPVAETPVRRFSFSPEDPIDVTVASMSSISPDGKYIVYAAEAAGQSALWLRPLDSESARRLEGTEGAGRGDWSPDSKSIVFGTDRELKRTPLDGGNPITLCELPGRFASFRGASSSPDGNRIIFSSGLKLYEVAARGGDPKLLFEPDESEGVRYLWAPHFLPSSGAAGGLVYTASLSSDDRRVELLDLNTGERRELGPGNVPRYSRSGHLIHGPGNRADTGLWALPFSLETLTATGEAFPIAEAGRYASVARDDTLVYLDSPGENLEILVWRDRSGKVLETVGQTQGDITYPTVSPDGRLLAVSASDGVNQNRDIWIHDPVRGTKTRITFDEGVKSGPTWSPSGREITYQWNQVDGFNIASKAADGTGEATVLVDVEASVHVPDWSHDGKHMAYHQPSSDDQRNIWYLRPSGDGFEPTVFLRTPANEATAKFSPDGRYLAYVSDESGRVEVYVRPFPEGLGKWQVSVNGGMKPRWRRDGSELFYVEESTLMAVSVSTEQGFILGQPQRLFGWEDFRSDRLTAYAGPQYDVSADGQRFLTTAPAEDKNARPPAIRVVQNWYEEFRDREQE